MGSIQSRYPERKFKVPLIRFIWVIYGLDGDLDAPRAWFSTEHQAKAYIAEWRGRLTFELKCRGEGDL